MQITKVSVLASLLTYATAIAIPEKLVPMKREIFSGVRSLISIYLDLAL